MRFYDGRLPLTAVPNGLNLEFKVAMNASGNSWIEHVAITSPVLNCPDETYPNMELETAGRFFHLWNNANATDIVMWGVDEDKTLGYAALSAYIDTTNVGMPGCFNPTSVQHFQLSPN